MNTVRMTSTDSHAQIARTLVQKYGPWDAYKIGIAMLSQSTQLIRQGLGAQATKLKQKANPTQR